MRAGILRRLRVRRVVKKGSGTTAGSGAVAAGVGEDSRDPVATRDRDSGLLGANVRWTPVYSSWIEALRFVPTGRQGNQALAYGYIDMKVKKRPRNGTGRYRYGPGISQRSFNTWIVAASRGKYWWRYFTARWSPAQPF